MFIKIYEFFIYYNKIIYREGITNYIWSLFIPLLIFFSLKINWFFKPPSLNEALPFFSAIWSYNIVSTYLYGLAGRIAIFRDNGFLRSFTYISGEKSSIIYSLFLMQIFHGSIFLILFTVVTSLCFHLSIFYMLTVAIVSFLISSIPIGCLVLIFAALPITPYTLNSVGSIVMLPALFITMFRDNIYTNKWDWLFLISPVEYVSQLSINVSNFINSGLFLSNISTLVLVTAVYVFIGIISWKFIKIYSLTLRT